MNDFTAPTSVTRAHSQLRRLLKSDFALEVLSRVQPPDASFRSFTSRTISVLDVRGAPIELRRSASRNSDVHLLRVERGTVRLAHADGSTTVRPGEIVAYRGGRAIQFRHEQSIDLLAVFLPARAIDRWLPEWQAAEFVVAKLQPEGRLSFDIARDLLRCSAQLPDSNAAEVVGETVARLFARALSITSLCDAAPPEELAEAHRRRVKLFCRKNLGSSDLCIDVVSQATGLARASLHRLFQAQPHTLMQWVQLERLEGCRRLLAEPGLPQRSLTEIALSLGFKSSAHFSAAFRLRYGLTPRDYRTSVRARGRSDGLHL